MQWFTTILQAFSKPLKWWIVIAPWEKGIRVRLGKTIVELEPGIHFRIPFLDRIYVQGSRLRYITYSGSTLSSKDKKVFNISIAIRYKINNLKKLYLTLADPEQSIYVNALSSISDYVCSSFSKDVTPEKILIIADKSVKELTQGLEDLKVSIVGFAELKCYRFITGDGWVPSSMSNLDDKDGSGER